MTYEEAAQFVNYGIRKGYFEEDDWKDLDDREFIEKAKKMMDIGDAYADAQRKQE